MDPVGDISTFKRYFYCILHAECYAREFHCRNKPYCAKYETIYTTLNKTERYFAPVENISTIKRYFHCILNAECSAALLCFRNKPNFAKNVTFYTILTKTDCYFAPVGDICTLKRYFHRILLSECYVCQLHRRMK